MSLLPGLAFVGAATLFACTDANPPGAILQFRSIESACALHPSVATPVEVDELSTFKWHRMFIFPPYSSRVDIDAILGFEWRDPKANQISDRDDVTLIAFEESGRIVASLFHPRNRGDFSELDLPQGIAPTDAKFSVQELDRGEPWCVVLLGR